MEFKIQERDNPHVRRYSQQDLDIAREFSKKAYKEFGSFVKAIVLFGSAARGKTGQSQDIDILAVVNDLTVVLTPEAVEAYRIIMQRLVADTNKRIHLTTLKFTNFWELTRKGDPIAINILRDGVAIIDSGVFDPLQALLYQGRIAPTYESIHTYLSRAPVTLNNSKWHVMQATMDLYWACIDSAHAALMKHGEIPPSPSHVADMLHEKLVKQKKLEEKYVHTMNKLYELSRKILHRETSDVSGREYDALFHEAHDFVARMKKIVETH